MHIIIGKYGLILNIIPEVKETINVKKAYIIIPLFAILAYKTYNKYDYRNTIENLKISIKL